MRCALYAGVVVGLLAAASGCNKQTAPTAPLMPKNASAGKQFPQSWKNSQTTSSTASPAVAQTIRKQPEGPKRPPKVETCLMAGKTFEESAEKSEEPAQRLQRLEQARKAYQQALNIDPKNQTATLGLARVYDREGDYSSAVRGYHEALKAQPNSAAIWHELGMCHARQKDWETAIEALSKASSLAPHNAAFSNHLGWTLARSGQYDAALAHFRRTVGPAKANYNLALMMKHLGYSDHCWHYCTAALRIDPSLEDAQLLLETVAPPPPRQARTATGRPPARAVPQSDGHIEAVEYREPAKAAVKPVSKPKAEKTDKAPTKPAVQTPKKVRVTSLKSRESLDEPAELPRELEQKLAVPAKTERPAPEPVESPLEDSEPSSDKAQSGAFGEMNEAPLTDGDDQ